MFIVWNHICISVYSNSQGYLPSLGSPFLIYDWKDSTKSNNILNIKVLLFQGPRTLNDFAVGIEEKGGQWSKIVISQSLPSSWLSMTHCMHAFKNTEGEDRIAQHVQESTMQRKSLARKTGRTLQWSRKLTFLSVVILIFWCGVRIKALGSGLIAGRFQGRQKRRRSQEVLKKMMTMTSWMYSRFN